MKLQILSLFTLFILQFSFSQEVFVKEQQITIDQFTDGTLLHPEVQNAPLMILIQGSGPVNRDGNAPMMKNNGMKKIAEELSQKGIATFRFDKRIFKMDKLKIKEENLSFDDFVTDVIAIVEHFRKTGSYNKIILAGHSEGSLIGILAAQKTKIDGFISFAGPGRAIDEIIVGQLSKQSQELSENARKAFNEIKANGSTQNYSPYLESIFRASVQPYIKSWMSYDPSVEIAKLEVPVLIITGSSDLQVDVTDAKILAEAKPGAELVILDNMNHIFRKIEGEDLENTKAYNEPERPLHEDLIPTILESTKIIK
jgi:esterase/lipase